MEMFAGRWARAEPTVAARARVLKNMLAMIFESEESIVCICFGWRGKCSKRGCKWVVLVRDGERKEGNQQGMGERYFIWARTKEQRGAGEVPSIFA
jgi:hypothetical protein